MSAWQTSGATQPRPPPLRGADLRSEVGMTAEEIRGMAITDHDQPWASLSVSRDSSRSVLTADGYREPVGRPYGTHTRVWVPYGAADPSRPALHAGNRIGATRGTGLKRSAGSGHQL